MSDTMNPNFTVSEVRAIRKALDAASGACDSLRRFHGHDVAQIALEGRNTVFSTNALGILASHGFCEEAD